MLAGAKARRVSLQSGFPEAVSIEMMIDIMRGKQAQRREFAGHPNRPARVSDLTHL